MFWLILSLICFGFVCFYIFTENFKKLPVKLEKYKKVFIITSMVSWAGLIFMTAMSIFEVDLLTGFSAYFPAVLIIASVLEAGVQVKLKKGDNKGFIKFISIAVLALSILEIFVFNMNSFHLLFGNYPMIEPAFDDMKISGLTFDSVKGGAANTGGSFKIEIGNINADVGTVFLDAEIESDSKAAQEINIDFSDSTTEHYKTDMASFEIIKNHPESGYAICSFSGDLSGIVIHAENLPGAGFLTVKGLKLNYTIPFKFNFIRVIVILAFLLLIYMLLKSNIFARPYSSKDKKQKAFVAGTMAVFMIFAVSLMAIYANSDGGNLFTKFTQTSGDQMTQELVDAFKNGRISLDLTIGEQLPQLENPYDPLKRNNEEIQHLWDHVYYEGKVYSYYGIAPVLLLFLPYHLLTGLYFSSAWACLLFGLLGVFFLVKLYMCVVKNLFKNLPFKLTLSGLIIVLSACGAWYCFCMPMFYEVAQTSGFCFVTAGAYFLMSSNIVFGEKIKNRRVVLGTSLLALAVLCRPTEMVYVLSSLVFLWYGFKKSDAKKKYLVAALLPYILIGSVQMIYNALRFGNPLEFGIQYSLTINDFTQAQFHWRLAAIGFFNFLFVAPLIKFEFPYFFSQFDDLSINGQYFIAYNNAIGLFFRVLPMFGYLFAARAYKKLEKGSRLKTVLLWGIPCVLCPLIIILSIWESGYGVRYSLDFAWQLILGAFLILFFLYQKSNNSIKKNIFEKLFIFSMVLSVAVNFSMVWTYLYPACISVDMQAMCIAFSRNFMFWL